MSKNAFFYSHPHIHGKPSPSPLPQSPPKIAKFGGNCCALNGQKLSICTVPKIFSGLEFTQTDKRSPFIYSSNCPISPKFSDSSPHEGSWRFSCYSYARAGPETILDINHVRSLVLANFWLLSWRWSKSRKIIISHGHSSNPRGFARGNATPRFLPVVFANASAERKNPKGLQIEYFCLLHSPSAVYRQTGSSHFRSRWTAKKNNTSCYMLRLYEIPGRMFSFN